VTEFERADYVSRRVTENRSNGGDAGKRTGQQPPSSIGRIPSTQRSDTARNFRELLEAMPPDRQRRIENRFRKSLAGMPLDQLRKAPQMTQLQLAEIPGVNQGEVSKIEHRRDICISTLAEYIEAMGGGSRSARCSKIERCGSRSLRSWQARRHGDDVDGTLKGQRFREF
jgi:hypothetical protein